MLLLTRREAASLLDLPTAIEVYLTLLREQGGSGVLATKPAHFFLPGGRLFRVVSGALPGSHRMGVRTAAGAGFAKPAAHALVYDSESGEPLCLMGFPWGQLRVAASMGAAIRLLARKGARQVALLGTGRNALGLLEAAGLELPAASLAVYSPTAEHRAAFVERAKKAGITVEQRPTARAAVEGADIVLVATSSNAPAFEAEWVGAGAAILSMGRPGEVPADCYLTFDRIFVGHRDQELALGALDRPRGGRVEHAEHPLAALEREGRLDLDARVHELSEAAAGTVPGRASDRERIVFRESQGGYGDIALAAHAYQKAIERGIGTTWDPDA